MKAHVEAIIGQALRAIGLEAGGGKADLEPQVERTRDPQHGDYTTNVALRAARALGRRPRELADEIAAALPASEAVESVEVAGPGFINFRMSRSAREQQLQLILEQGDHYGRSELGEGREVIVEFVSANPTGPLHVGHGRHAAYGASLAALLEATGHRVHREYYVNDAGRQMDILAVSVWLRYLEDGGATFPFPANAYRGEYVREIAKELRARHSDRLQVESDFIEGLPPDAPEGDKEDYIDAVIRRAQSLLNQHFQDVLQLALEAVLEDIREDLEDFGVRFDHWYSERTLKESGAVERALEELRGRGLLFERDGATWFQATRFGDEKDRVVIRENGVTTYFASDIAYHREKRERGFHHLLDVLGADHHGYVPRIRAGMQALGGHIDQPEVRLVQFVILYRAGERAQMSTRSGEFVTLRALREEVGNDAARLFYVMRSNDQHLEFDLELAKSRSQENPVYYIQYAHARVCSIFSQLAGRGLDFELQRALFALGRLKEDHEERLLKTLTRYPEVIELAAANRAPQNLVHYLRDLANDFHTYYNAHTVLVEDDVLRDARLALCAATRQVLRNGLTLLGVTAPDRM